MKLGETKKKKFSQVIYNFGFSWWYEKGDKDNVVELILLCPTK
jgi:hypothetical protein